MRHRAHPLISITLAAAAWLAGAGFAFAADPVFVPDPVRTPGALYRFLRGFGGQFVAAHHIFDGSDTEQAWQRWLDNVTPEGTVQ